MHYHAPTKKIGPLPNRVGMITNFPLATAETHRAHGYHPVAEVVYVEGAAPGVEYDYDTRIATVTRVPVAPLPSRLEIAATDEGWADWERGIVPVAAKLIQLWQATGVAGLPDTWQDAILLLGERYDALTDVAARLDLLAVTTEAKQWREIMESPEIGGEWGDVLVVAGILGATLLEADLPVGLWARVRGWFGM